MSYQSLQNAYQLQQPTRENVDPTKELLKQGSNFAKEMSGERGIMAAVEGAHFRPIIQKYIKSKLADPSGFVNSIQKDVQGVRQKASSTADRLVAGADRITESLQGAGGELRGDPNVGRPALTGERQEIGRRAEPQTGQLERETETGGYGSESLEAVPKVPSFGEDLRVPRGGGIDQPFESLFPNAPAKEAELGTSMRGSLTSQAESAAARARALTTEGGQQLGDVLRGGAPEQARAVPKPTPEPSVPSASTPAVERQGSGADPRAPIEPRGELDEHGLPKLPDTENVVGKDIAKEEVKTAPIEAEEAEAPGIGDVLAVGTALYGAVKGAIEGGEAKKAAMRYIAPAMPSVAMDSSPSFDSAFRGN